MLNTKITSVKQQILHKHLWCRNCVSALWVILHLGLWFEFPLSHSGCNSVRRLTRNLS